MLNKIFFVGNAVGCAGNAYYVAAAPDAHPMNAAVMVFGGLTALYMLIHVARDVWRK